MAQITDLPPEILHNVFQHLISLPREELYWRVRILCAIQIQCSTLSQVCPQWRDILRQQSFIGFRGRRISWTKVKKKGY